MSYKDTCGLITGKKSSLMLVLSQVSKTVKFLSSFYRRNSSTRGCILSQASYLRNPNEICKLKSSAGARPVMRVSMFRMHMRLPVSLTMTISLHLSLPSWLAIMDKKRRAFGPSIDRVRG